MAIGMVLYKGVLSGMEVSMQTLVIIQKMGCDSYSVKNTTDSLGDGVRVSFGLFVGKVMNSDKTASCMLCDKLIFLSHTA